MGDKTSEINNNKSPKVPAPKLSAEAPKIRQNGMSVPRRPPPPIRRRKAKQLKINNNNKSPKVPPPKLAKQINDTLPRRETEKNKIINKSQSDKPTVQNIQTPTKQ